MTGQHVEILAHHGLLLAIPAFVPAVAVAGVITYIAVRDRRSGAEAQKPGDQTKSSNHDGSP